MSISTTLTEVHWRRRRVLQGLGSALLLPGICGSARAQLGAKPARLVVGFAAGGNGDALARGLVEELKDLFKAGLVVENRAGAAGRLAVEAVKAAEPDGNTLLYSPAALLTILPHAAKPGTFLPLSSLVPVAAVSKQDFAIVAAPGTGMRSVKELLAAAKNDAALRTYGTAGAGTPQHFIGHLLGSTAGVKLTHVPYKGGSAALQDTLGGHTPLCIAALSEQLMSLGKEGRVHILGVAGTKRSNLLPTVPTLQEQGFPSIAVEDWSGVLVPAKTPAAVVEQIEKRLLEITSSAAYATAMTRTGQEPLSVGANGYAARLQEESARWASIVKAAGFTLDS